MDFFSAPWKFPGQKGTDPSHGHSPRGRAPRPGLELGRGIRNRSVNKTFVLGMPFENVSVKLQPGIRVTCLLKSTFSFSLAFSEQPREWAGGGGEGGAFYSLKQGNQKAVSLWCAFTDTLKDKESET